MKDSHVHPTRHSLTRLPHWTQGFFTWLTACALPDQKPVFKLSAGQHLFITTLTLIISIAAGVYLGHQIQADILRLFA